MPATTRSAKKVKQHAALRKPRKNNSGIRRPKECQYCGKMIKNLPRHLRQAVCKEHKNLLSEAQLALIPANPKGKLVQCKECEAWFWESGRQRHLTKCDKTRDRLEPSVMRNVQVYRAVKAGEEMLHSCVSEPGKYLQLHASRYILQYRAL